MIQAIGKLTVPVPGTPTRASSTQADPAQPTPIHGILFQALTGNTGRIYIGLAGMNKATLAGVLAVLPIPTSSLIPTFSAALTWSPNALRLEQFYLDADVADDGALCTILIA